MNNIKIYYYEYKDSLIQVGDHSALRVLKTPCPHRKTRIGSDTCYECECFVLWDREKQYVACTPYIIMGEITYA